MQVSFFDCLVSFVCLSVLFSHLLQNHRANFNQTWHKASLGEGDSSFIHMKCHALFQREICVIVKIHGKHLKVFSIIMDLAWLKASFD